MSLSPAAESEITLMDQIRPFSRLREILQKESVAAKACTSSQVPLEVGTCLTDSNSQWTVRQPPHPRDPYQRNRH
jgi:hypothetical protein